MPCPCVHLVLVLSQYIDFISSLIGQCIKSMVVDIDYYSVSKFLYNTGYNILFALCKTKQ
jgi:hypothetical protein